jgi:rubrerythrin
MRTRSTGTFHDAILAQVMQERRRLSRRGLLVGGGKAAAGGALVLTLGSAGLRSAGAQDATPADGAGDAPFADDIEVLNYALTLEHLEYAFYRDGVGLFDFGTDGFGQSVNANLAAIRDHEGAHVQALTQVISSLGGSPVTEAAYDFGDAYSGIDAFLATAAALENTGVSAYDGAGQYISDTALLTAAGEIVAVEARHASYLNLITNEVPFPAAFETPLSPDEVLEIAGPFILS